MITTICGHDRDVLIWALAELERRNESERATFRLMATFTPMFLEMPIAGPCVAAIVDPAKLAEMMAEELRRLGYILPPPRRNNHPESECPNDGFRVKGLAPRGFEPRIDIEWRLPSGRGSRVLFMPEARNILLQWLRLPAGARDEAERVLRGET